MAQVIGETMILEQQKEELEVLENIYLREMDIVKSTPPYKISIELRPFLEHNIQEALEKLTIKLQIELSKSYPYEFPKCQFIPLFSDITQTNISEMENLVQKIMEQHKDSPMIFEIVENIREWIQKNIIKKEMLEKEPNSEEDEQIIQKERVVYTPVTRESFLEWKAKFDAEHSKKEVVITEAMQKLTGRDFFEKHKAEAMAMDDDEEDEEEEK